MTDIQKSDYLHLRILGAPLASSEGAGSPIIDHNLAYFKNKDSTKITYSIGKKQVTIQR